MGEEPPSIATKGVIKTIPMRERAVSYRMVLTQRTHSCSILTSTEYTIPKE